MKRFWLLFVGMLVSLLAVFFVVEALGHSPLTDPSPYLAEPGLLAATVGVGLLVVDVFLPVPSSVVMVAHGALFGVLGGAALSLLGCLGAAALAFGIGRCGGPMVTRLVGVEERAKADALFSRYGGLAVLVSRPLPLLAETVAILAGTTPMSWRTLLGATVLGAAPPSLLYALTGATAASLDHTALVFGVVLLVAGLAWFVGRRVEEGGRS
jgi:uncharacterized membrane protein YdjX (TVP38/TMEM64 family)